MDLLRRVMLDFLRPLYKRVGWWFKSTDGEETAPAAEMPEVELVEGIMAMLCSLVLMLLRLGLAAEIIWETDFCMEEMEFVGV